MMIAPPRPGRGLGRTLCLVALWIVPSATGAEAFPPQKTRSWQLGGDQPDLNAKLTKIGKGQVDVLAEAGRKVTLQLNRLGTEDLRYVRNLGAVTNPFRTWTVEHPDEVMADSMPGELRASFVRYGCADAEFSEAVVELILDDGRRRIYPLKIFGDEDRRYAERMRQEDQKAPRKGPPYATAYTEYSPDRDGSAVNFRETPHFLFMSGNDRSGSGKVAVTDPAFLPARMAYFEQVWDFYERQMKAPMPMARADRPTKLKVFVTGTGLPRHAEGFAFGAESIVIHPGALGEGSSVVPHEFGHVLQFYSGGFRDSPKVGWFWECHANWSGHQYNPAYAPSLEVYLERAHYELSSSRMNYGSWPFLQWIGENPRFDPGFNYRIWLASAESVQGFETPDPFEVIMGLGVREGRLKGDGVQGFGDLIGETAARMAAWDLAGWYSYEKSSRNLRRYAAYASRSRALMEPVPDRAGWWRPSVSQAPRQYGINLIDLAPEPGASTVEAELHGFVDPTEKGDWRATLVAIDGQGRARYSRMVRGGKLSLAVASKRERLVLAVAAAPDAYRPMQLIAEYGRKPRYLYEVRFQHARPRAEPDEPLGPPVEGSPHPNGGGFVASSASAAPSAYVGPEARVLDGARIEDRARVEGHALVGDRAVISGRAIVRDHAVVRGEAHVGGEARVGGSAFVHDKADLGEHARVLEAVHLDGEGVVRGRALFRGWGEVHLSPKTEIAGGAVFGEDLEIHLGTAGRPRIDTGLLHGFMAEADFKAEIPDNQSLYARWTFDEPHGEVLADAVGDCLGVIRGAPAYANRGGRGVLTLNGKDQYAVVEGHLLESPELTIEAAIRCEDATPGRRLFAFVGPDSELSFTPRDAQGHAALTIRKGKTTERLVATEAIPAEKWARVSILLAAPRGEIRLDGRVIASRSDLTLRPEDLRAEAGYLGRSADGKAFFRGQLDELAFIRAAALAADPPAASRPAPGRTPKRARPGR